LWEVLCEAFSGCVITDITNVKLGQIYNKKSRKWKWKRMRNRASFQIWTCCTIRK
jgi:hypothetical protein